MFEDIDFINIVRNYILHNPSAKALDVVNAFPKDKERVLIVLRELYGG